MYFTTCPIQTTTIGYDHRADSTRNKPPEVKYSYVMYHSQTPNSTTTTLALPAVANTDSKEVMEELQRADTNSSLAAAPVARQHHLKQSMCATTTPRFLRVPTAIASRCVAAPWIRTSSTPRFTTYTETPFGDHLPKINPAVDKTNKGICNTADVVKRDSKFADELNSTVDSIINSAD
ncbi:hypothetical protein PHYPSEUDO_000214 [Phytophthora pseudosyringae]|uniref:Uncharacterized protein n=1 Tax=Phytophthora pseudosyringae TaxID=221518 RepID=A0A8T1WGH8_9STRA|nr:hypothetical protein PHYPSEUDO_000214 [Phytophthora pseudosyringae]